LVTFGHVNVTNGRYVYMRAAANSSNSPLEEFTLMPTHMRSRFAVSELQSWEPAEPFSFTKGVRTLRMSTRALFINSWQHGSLLFDLQTDPEEEHPIVDDEVELKLLRLLARALHDNDAPRSQFERLGIPFDAEPGREHLLVRIQAQRAEATAEPLPDLSELPAVELLAMPILALLQGPHARDVLERHTPSLVQTELVAAAAQLSLLDLARTAHITAATLQVVAADLALQPVR
jgi:hypothetical protein